MPTQLIWTPSLTIDSDPSDLIDYEFLWESLPSTDVIISSSWSITPSGDLFVAGSVLTGPKSVLVWISGGIAGNDYRVSNLIVTAAGRRIERSFKNCVKEL